MKPITERFGTKTIILYPSCFHWQWFIYCPKWQILAARIFQYLTVKLNAHGVYNWAIIFTVWWKIGWIFECHLTAIFLMVNILQFLHHFSWTIFVFLSYYFCFTKTLCCYYMVTRWRYVLSDECRENREAFNSPTMRKQA